MRISVLGPLEVRDASGAVVPVGGARLRSLLIRLAIADGHPVPVERLADDLWADSQPADAANAIQALVSRLRGAAGRDCVEFGPAGYRLSVACEELDAAVFAQLVASGHELLSRGDQAGGAALLRQALGLWRGQPLADVADLPFAAAPVTRLSELRLAATEDLIDAELALGRGAGLVPWLQELAGAHPLRERLRGQLMLALRAAGRQADALAVFEDIRAELADQLGVDPSPALAAVHLAILRGEAGPSGPDGPPRLAPPEPAVRELTNLPAQLTSFVGRDGELRRVAKLLAESRLVTLTGPGGAGKTRLSVESSARLGEDYPDGIWFVPLAPVHDALDVPQAVLTAVGLHEVSWLDPSEVARLAATEPLDRLTQALARRRLILVLDNCEHLVDAVARLAGQVLERAPQVRILATSREPLGITGETLCPVPSLELPPPDAGPAEAAEHSSVRLFADRAAAVRPGFTLDEASTGPVVRICRALDGIPLAIELAAARLRALTPAQVADRLDDRFRLLSVGSRTALPRHQTLRAIVDWSWELLDGAERTVLSRLAVFSSGATPDSAEWVCALDGDPAPVLDIIASLVDKSLVTASGEQEVRYRLLETVRAYASERLAEAGEETGVRDAHAAYFVELSERGEPLLRTREQVYWLNRLTAEHDNCAAALRHAIDSGDTRLALRFVGALALFWLMRDYDAEAGEWAGAVQAIAGDAPPPGLRDAYAICQLVAMIAQGPQEFPGISRLREILQQTLDLAAGTSHPLLVLASPMVCLLTGDMAAARDGLAALAEHPDPWLRAARHLFQGHLSMGEGQVDEADRSLAASRAAFDEIGDRWGLILTLGGQAEVAMARGQPGRAVVLLEDARRKAAEGLASNFSEMMGVQLGRAKASAGDTEGARAELRHVVKVASRIGEPDHEASGYLELSQLTRREGDLDGAGALLGQALEITEPMMHKPGVRGQLALLYSASGCLAEQRGDLPAATAWHAKALASLAQDEAAALPFNGGLASVIEGVAALAAARGETVRSAELLGLAVGLRGFRDDASLEVQRVQAAITSAGLTPAEVEAATARGRALTKADALALVP
ncbi:MAG TPA: BTAD domain-containing putative transcriptional regulator [Streptosporangiaceae bacterium]